MNSFATQINGLGGYIIGDESACGTLLAPESSNICGLDEQCTCHYSNSACLPENIRGKILLSNPGESYNGEALDKSCIIYGHILRNNQREFLSESIDYDNFNSLDTSALAVSGAVIIYFLPFFEISRFAFHLRSPAVLRALLNLIISFLINYTLLYPLQATQVPDANYPGLYQFATPKLGYWFPWSTASFFYITGIGGIVFGLLVMVENIINLFKKPSFIFNNTLGWKNLNFKVSMPTFYLSSTFLLSLFTISDILIDNKQLIKKGSKTLWEYCKKLFLACACFRHGCRCNNVSITQTVTNPLANIQMQRSGGQARAQEAASDSQTLEWK